MAETATDDADADDDDPTGPWPEDGEIRYLNTDLDLDAGPEVELSPLVDALDRLGVRPMPPPDRRRYAGGWYVNFSTRHQFREPEATIAAMLDAFDRLDPAARDLWAACTRREFNPGYDCGDRPWAFNQALSNETLRRIADAGATLRITIYPLRPACPAAATPPTGEPEPT